MSIAQFGYYVAVNSSQLGRDSVQGIRHVTVHVLRTLRVLSSGLRLRIIPVERGHTVVTTVED